MDALFKLNQLLNYVTQLHQSLRVRLCVLMFHKSRSLPCVSMRFQTMSATLYMRYSLELIDQVQRKREFPNLDSNPHFLPETQT